MATTGSAGDWRDALAFEPVGTHNDGLDISSAVRLTVPTGSTKIMIQALAQDIRFTLDGATTPTSTKGFQLKADDPVVIIPLGNVTEVRVIEEAATADMQYQFGK